MAYWIYDAGNRNSSLWRFFMCDYLSELKDLPTATKDGKPQQNDTVCKNKCCPGSQCFCLEDSSIWILGKDSNQWIKKKSAHLSEESSGGIEITENSIKPIPSDSIQSLF